MTTTGPNSPSNWTVLNTGGPTWSGMSNIVSSNNAYATSSLSNSEISDAAVGRGFGFAIPIGDIIDGIQAEFEIKRSSLATVHTVRLTKNSTAMIGSNLASDESIPSGDAYVSYGGPTQLWGTTWTPAEINDANFGACIMVEASAVSSPTVSLDHIRVTITHHTAPKTPIGTTKSLSYGIRTRIQQTRSLSFSIRTMVAVEREMQFNVLFAESVSVETGAGLTLWPPLFNLTLYEPAPSNVRIADLDINVDITSLEFTDSSPGGFSGMTVGLRRTIEVQPGVFRNFGPLEFAPFVRPMMHGVLKANTVIVYEGRLVETEAPAGITGALIFSGYAQSALDDNLFITTDETETTSGAIIRQALQAAAPLLLAGTSHQFDDPGVPHAPVEFTLLTPMEIINQIVGEGGVTTSPFTYYVREGRILWLQELTPPETPLYKFVMDDTVTVHRDFRQMYSACRVVFNMHRKGQFIVEAGNTSATIFHNLLMLPFVDEVKLSSADDIEGWVVTGTTVTTFDVTFPGALATARTVDWEINSPDTSTDLAINGGFQGQWGFTRAALIRGGQMTPTAANAYRDSFLAAHGVPEISASVTRAADRGVEMSTGGFTPAWLIPAGEWVQLGDDYKLQIVTKSVDANTGITMFELGAVPPSFPAMVQRMLQVERAAERQVHPKWWTRLFR